MPRLEPDPDGLLESRAIALDSPRARRKMPPIPDGVARLIFSDTLPRNASHSLLPFPHQIVSARRAFVRSRHFVPFCLFLFPPCQDGAS